MDTDFWGVVVPNWIAASGGLIGTLLAVVSLLVALRARGTADRAVANDAETREAVAIVAKPPVAVTGSASSTLPPLTSQAEGTTTPPPTRSAEDQATLDRILRERYPSNSHKSRRERGKIV